MIGFVYKWHDVACNRFYIGSHYGELDDGYICSSREMKKEYRRRPLDFEREILETVDGSRFALLAKETEWLKEIPDSELGKQYYNKSKNSGPWWIINPEARKLVIEKMRKASLGRTAWNAGKTGLFKHSEEEKKKRSESMRTRWQDEEWRQNFSQTQTGKRHTEEAIRKMCLVQKGHRSGMAGKKMTEEHKKGISEGNKRRWVLRKAQGVTISEDHKKKVSEGTRLWWQKRKAMKAEEQRELL